MPGGDTIVTFSLVPAPADAETASREIAALREQLGEAGERERALARMQARLLARAGAAPLLSNRLALQKQAAQVAIRRDASQARMASAKAALAEQNAAVAEQKAVRRANGAREEAAAPAIATAAPSPAASSIADPVAVAATPPPWLSTAPDEAAPRTIDQRLSPALALARQIGLRFVSGYRPGAIIAGTMNLSDHSRFPSEAIDLGGSASAMQRYALAVAQLPAVDTVIYSPVGVWKAGTGWKSISSPITRRDHFDHVHVDTF